MLSAAPSIVGALGLIALALYVFLIIWRIRNPVPPQVLRHRVPTGSFGVRIVEEAEIHSDIPHSWRGK